MSIGKNTNELSFILKPSTIPGAGIGVFATHDIAKGSFMRFFGDEDSSQAKSYKRNKNELPIVFQEYCLKREDHLICPQDFGHIPIGWYLNHSLSPNATNQTYKWYAHTDIKAGEEIFIDYNSFDEPEESKPTYYNR